ncbi:MAG: FKBP-type peptidyl-prolyl cis-trans isomerase [Flavobacteriales bacterium]
MKKIIFSLFLSLPILATAQKGSKSSLKLNEEYTTESGLKIKLTKQGKGLPVQKGDRVKVHYTGTLVDGKKFDSSKDRNEPFQFIIGLKQVIAGWDEGIALLRVGDEATLTIPPELGYGNRRTGNIPPGAYLIFDVELLDVEKDVMPKPFEIKDREMKTTVSGLKYGIVQQGDGKQATKGSNVEVHYTGFLENGDVFDSSVMRGQPISFRLGAGMVIKGWDEGIALLREGAKAKLVIPYPLAYGEQGMPPTIPEKATLIFNVELISVK